MWPDDLNWQMTLLFLLALAIMGFVMKLVSWLMPAGARTDRPFMSWLLPSPNTLVRSQPVVSAQRVLLRTLLLFGSVSLSYWIYWQLVGSFHIRGLLLSYLAAPILLLVSELLVAVATVLFLPGGRLLPSLHDRPLFPNGVADFWGNRWNLWFSDWFRYAIFARLRRRPVLALFLVFALSGLMHEWVINVPLYYLTGSALFGSMMIYFLVQAAGIQLERHFLRSRPCLMVAFAWLVVFVPSPLVLNEGLLRTLHLWPKQEVVAKRSVVVDDDVDVHNTSEVLFRLCANTDPQRACPPKPWRRRNSIFTRGPTYVLDHATSEIALGSKLGIDATKRLPGEDLSNSSSPRPPGDRRPFRGRSVARFNENSKTDS